ncbi:MAG: ATP-dependent DNA ligase [Verrucomicrobiota bacterium]
MMDRAIKVEFRRGAFLSELDLWLDPHDRKPEAFVSHAHADHVAPHQTAICSATTKLFVEKRFGRRGELMGYEFGKAFDYKDHRVELIPAGHILGSAQIHLDGENGSLLYTGDFKLRTGVASEATEAKHADTLIMETTYGIPKYRLPPNEEVVEDMVRFVRESLEEGTTPMLAAYSLGKAQEVMMALGRRAPELQFLLHPSAAKMSRIYREIGYALPPYQSLEPGSRFEGQVVIAPPNAIRSQQLRKVKNRTTAMISGWGIDPSARFRYQVDHVFPLSDHADYDDLLRYVEMVQPQRILTLHGYADEFSADLRARGWEAWSLTGENQLELFGAAPSTANPQTTLTQNGDSLRALHHSEFRNFAEIGEAIAATTGKLKKVELLADYFSHLDLDALPFAVVFLSGKPFERTDQHKSLSVGWAITRRALLEATNRTEAEYRQIAQGQGDSGRAAFLLLEGKTQPASFSLRQIRDHFEELAAARGPVAKAKLLSSLLCELHPLEGKYLVKLLSGDLRIGLKEGLIEEAISLAFDAPVAKVRRAHMLTGKIGQTATLAKSGQLEAAKVTPFVPIKVMLASPEETADGIWKRLGESGQVWLEDKFDGIRAQLHKSGSEVQLFSRDLRPLHAEFHELLDPARELRDDVIFDGEIIAYAEGKKLTFFDLQKRLGRLNDSDLFLGASVPVRFIAFDLLWLNGEGLLDRPLEERRKLLESVDVAEPFEVCSVRQAGSETEIEAEFKAARQRDNEGLIAKDPLSGYSPGLRGLSWLKLKKPMATLDCVVVKVEQGHGKRNHVLSDYTFAVRDTNSGELVVIGKAYTGLTDKEIEDLTEHFQEHTLSKSRRSQTVEPNVVLEIAFDSINPSKRHNSGLAMRFPRIKAIRHDKTIEEIDTLAFARKLAGLQG